MTANPRPRDFSSVTLDDHLCFALYSASMAVGRLYKPMLDDLGLTYPQYLTLRALHEGGALIVGAIAERLALEPSTMTPLVKRLEARGLVRRERSADDERQVIVSLSENGRRLVAEAACLGPALFEASALDPATLARLNSEIRALRDAIDAWRENRASL